MTEAIRRRDFLERSAAAMAALVGLSTARPATAATGIDPDLLPMLPRIRDRFANRNPILARSPWVPAASGCQHFQLPVGGPRPGADANWIAFEQSTQLQNMADSIETSIYYGRGIDRGHGPTMTGLRETTESNRIDRAYPGPDVPIDFFLEAVGRCPAADTMLASSDMIKALGRDGGLETVEAGAARADVTVRLRRHAKIPGVAIVECPLMRPRTAVALSSADVRILSQADPHWSTRRPPHPEIAGDWMCSMAVDVRDGSQHCWAEAKVA